VLAFIGDEEFRETLPDRDELLAEAARAADDDALATLVELYWSLVSDDDLVGRSARQLLDTTAHHRRLADRRLPGEVLVEIDCPSDAEGPDAASSTRVDIVCDDSPFLVDSLSGLFTRRGIDINVFVHPIVPGERIPLAFPRLAWNVDLNRALPHRRPLPPLHGRRTDGSFPRARSQGVPEEGRCNRSSGRGRCGDEPAVARGGRHWTASPQPDLRFR
jgi:hypothetical protein